MNLLALHTTGETGSVAIARCGDDGVVVLEQREMAAKTFTAALTSTIEEALLAAQLAWLDAGAIAVAAGPGSFTGIRIGLATAKGLAEASGLPLLLVSSLALLAARLPRALAVLDAGRDEFYVGEYSGSGQQMLWERLLTREAMLAAPPTENAGWIACEEHVADVLGQAGATVLLVSPPDAASVARWAGPRMLRGESSQWELADGSYLRRSDAEVKLQAAR